MFRVGVMRVDGDGEGKRTRGGFPISREEIPSVCCFNAWIHFNMYQ